MAGDPENLQIMYGIAGERELGENELTWLTGYENSRPVRVGNGAAGQLQLDVYGEVTEALHLAHNTGLARNDYASLLQLKLIQWVEKHWDEPDEGIWEVRGPRRHFVHSKVMTWVAVDRTIKLIESGDVDGPLDRWKQLRETIHREVCEKGYDKERPPGVQPRSADRHGAAAHGQWGLRGVVGARMRGHGTGRDPSSRFRAGQKAVSVSVISRGAPSSMYEAKLATSSKAKPYALPSADCSCSTRA